MIVDLTKDEMKQVLFSLQMHVDAVSALLESPDFEFKDQPGWLDTIKSAQSKVWAVYDPRLVDNRLSQSIGKGAA